MLGVVCDGCLLSGFSSQAELVAHLETSCEQMVMETDAADLLPGVRQLLTAVKTFMTGPDDPVRHLYCGLMVGDDVSRPGANPGCSGLRCSPCR